MSTVRCRVLGLFALIITGVMANAAANSNWSVHWYVIGSGGGLFSESADGQWSVSGTVSQWEATEADALSGGEWTLTGGFWSVNVEEDRARGLIFSDRFEK